jgi:hypothetical protein
MQLLEFRQLLDSKLVDPYATIIGVSPDIIRLCVCQIVQLCIGHFMANFVRGALFRHLFTSAFGLLLMLYLYGVSLFWAIALSGITYLAMNFLPRHKQHFFVYFWAFGVVSYGHIEAMWTNWGGYEVSDIRTVTMLLALRCISVSVCYRDGAKDPTKLTPR